MTSQTHEVSFDVTPYEEAMIRKIAARARRIDLDFNHGRARSLLDWRMDITACHANGTALRLADLLVANDFNFIHDVFGIARHLDRDTGAIGGCFFPRAARPARAAAGATN